jgi:gliotoxin/aspirochlorine biosynthesis glutathione S-transferase
VLAVIDTKDAWYYQIHPERYVPALKDEDPVTKEKVVVFEGTACLQYLADRFDRGGDWTGRTAFEKAAVFSWTAFQTAGIGCVVSTDTSQHRADDEQNAYRRLAVQRPNIGSTS